MRTSTWSFHGLSCRHTLGQGPTSNQPASPYDIHPKICLYCKWKKRASLIIFVDRNRLQEEEEEPEHQNEEEEEEEALRGTGTGSGMTMTCERLDQKRSRRATISALPHPAVTRLAWTDECGASVDTPRQLDADFLFILFLLPFLITHRAEMLRQARVRHFREKIAN